MIADILTVVWKERKGLLRYQGGVGPADPSGYAGHLFAHWVELRKRAGE